MAGITIKQQLEPRQKNNYLMNDFSCVHGEKFEKNKKESYCTKCIHSMIVEGNKTICIYGLDANW